jgi:tetratricopeptide (TPR) repeat protein
MWVSDSYEDIAARARNERAQGNLSSALANFQRISTRLAAMKPEVMARRPELRMLRAVSLAEQAAIHRFQGDFEPALALYQTLSELVPEQGQAWRRLASLTYIDMGQAERGLDELLAQAVAKPGNHDAWLTIGSEYNTLGRLEEAEENLQRAARQAGAPEARAECHLTLFDYYRDHGRIDEALAAWNAAWQALGKDADVIFPVYQMLMENDRYEQAAEYLARETNPLRRGFYQGMLDAAAGRADEATKRWQKVARMEVSKHDDGHEAWAEAALRVDAPARGIVGALEGDWQASNISSRGLILLAIARARLGRSDLVEHALTAARNLGLQMRPRHEKLSPANWALFDELVADPEIKRSVCHLFAGCDQSDIQTT